MLRFCLILFFNWFSTTDIEICIRILNNKAYHKNPTSYCPLKKGTSIFLRLPLVYKSLNTGGQIHPPPHPIRRMDYLDFLTCLTYIQTIIFRAHTVCPRSSDPFYIVSYYIKWVSTSWAYRNRFELKIVLPDKWRIIKQILIENIV